LQEQLNVTDDDSEEEKEIAGQAPCASK
jgi:hypothetical protein